MTKRGNPTDFESFLTWEALVSILSYDSATGEFRWRDDRNHRVKVGTVAGSVDTHEGSGYRRIEILGRGFNASRLAWFYMTKAWPDRLIDHKNGNRSDDRWDNLRPADRLQNGANRATRKDTKSGVNGVYQTASGKWIARCRIGNKRFNLGSYDTIEEAAKARQDFNVENLGEFVRERAS
jgi:hypothetical protein